MTYRVLVIKQRTGWTNQAAVMRGNYAGYPHLGANARYERLQAMRVNDVWVCKRNPLPKGSLHLRLRAALCEIQSE